MGAIEWLDAFGWKNLETLNTSHQNLFCNSFVQGGVVGTHPQWCWCFTYFGNEQWTYEVINFLVACVQMQKDFFL
jgi:hypothetical protein